MTNLQYNEEAIMRMCKYCGKPLKIGFCVHQGAEYYCSTKCLEKKYTQKQIDKLRCTDDCFYMEWE